MQVTNHSYFQQNPPTFKVYDMLGPVVDFVVESWDVFISAD